MIKPFGIYIHIPFCIHKCSYCDFYSFTQFDDELKSKYETRLMDEVKSAADFLTDKAPVSTIFFGGGTPSLMSVRFYERLFTTLQKNFEWTPDLEITMEANPETIEEKYLRDLKNFTPINRISMGAQSFQKKYLEALERLGNSQSIRQAAALLKQVGYENFNLDLIFAIPDQTIEESLSDLKEAMTLEPKHISFYQLTLKPGHRLFSKLPTMDKGADFFVAAKEQLASANFLPYEISNFSRPNYECRHNLTYWEGEDYLGLGPSAASRFFKDGTFRHRKQIADIKKYLTQASFEEVEFEVTNLEQTQLEALFLELRTNKGLSLSKFQTRYQWKLPPLEKFQDLLNHRYVELTGDSLRLTDQGLLLEESIVLKLLS